MFPLFKSILAFLLGVLISFLVVGGVFAALLPSAPVGEYDGGKFSLLLRQILGSTAISSYGGDGTVANSDTLDGIDSTGLQIKIIADCPAGEYITSIDADGQLGCDGVVPPPLNQTNLYCWGNNSSNALGTSATGAATTPEYVLGGPTNFVKVAVGGWDQCAITDDENAYCWGRNRTGVAGDGTKLSSGAITSPKLVPGGYSFVDIGVGIEYACGLTSAGDVYCWGKGTDGRLGYGGTSEKLSPTKVNFAGSFSALSVGSGHACALTATGSAYCWGTNTSGQLGDGSISHSSNPKGVIMPGGVSFSKIAASDASSTCALSLSGSAYCWGDNKYPGPFYGNLGIGFSNNLADADIEVPTLVQGGHTFMDIAAEGRAYCGLKLDGTTYCWGEGDAGLLGNGGIAPSLSPVLVSGAQTFVSINGSEETNWGITGGGDLYYWGGTVGSAGQALSPSKKNGIDPIKSVESSGPTACAVIGIPNALPPPPPPPPPPSCGTASGQTLAVAPSGADLCSTGTGSAVSASGSSFDWTCSSGTPVDCSARLSVAITCPDADIVLGNGQVWKACNVGASSSNVASTDSYGAYFQWGRNISFTSTGTILTTPGPLSLIAADATTRFIYTLGYPNDWLAPKDNNRWGGSSTSWNTGTFVTAGISNQVLMQGPCESGYHVPTMKEWCDAIDFIHGTSNCIPTANNLVLTTLKLSYAGSRDDGNGINDYGNSGYYWTSSPNIDVYGGVIILGAINNPNSVHPRYRGNSVRCMKNSLGTNSCSSSTPACEGTGCTLTTGTPTSSGQLWIKDAPNCGFSCINGYTGSTCAIPPPANYCNITLPACNGVGCSLTYNPTSLNQSWVKNAGSCGFTCMGGYSGPTCSIPPANYCNPSTPACDGVGCSLTTGSPSSAGQAWVKNAPNCGFTCMGGYSGPTCSTPPVNSCNASLPACSGLGRCSLTYSPTSVNQTWIKDAGSCGFACTGGWTGGSCSVPPPVNSCNASLPACSGLGRCSLTYSPTSVNQTWIKDAGSCGFACTGGWSGGSCSVPPPVNSCNASLPACSGLGRCSLTYSPTSVNQTWIKDAGSCGFACTGGWTGGSCSVPPPVNSCNASLPACSGLGRCSLTYSPTSVNQTWIKDAGSCGFACTGGWTGGSCSVPPPVNSCNASLPACSGLGRCSLTYSPTSVNQTWIKDAGSCGFACTGGWTGGSCSNCNSVPSGTQGIACSVVAGTYGIPVNYTVGTAFYRTETAACSLNYNNVIWTDITGCSAPSYPGTWTPGSCSEVCMNGTINAPTCSGGACDPATRPASGQSCNLGACWGTCNDAVIGSCGAGSFAYNLKSLGGGFWSWQCLKNGANAPAWFIGHPTSNCLYPP